ncbi:MAG TPA: pilin [Candidatus Paceibacterota bacterium]
MRIPPTTLLLLLSTLIFVGGTHLLFAAGGVNTLQSDVISGNGDLPTFLNSLFRIGVGIAAFLAVIMLAVGGFQYMGSDSVFSKENGVQQMQAAVFGLILILASFLILRTINPSIVSLQIGGGNLDSTYQGGGAGCDSLYENCPTTATQNNNAGGVTQTPPPDCDPVSEIFCTPAGIKQAVESGGNTMIGTSFNPQNKTNEQRQKFQSDCQANGGGVYMVFQQWVCVKK